MLTNTVSTKTELKKTMLLKTMLKKTMPKKTKFKKTTFKKAMRYTLNISTLFPSPLKKGVPMNLNATRIAKYLTIPLKMSPIAGFFAALLILVGAGLSHANAPLDRIVAIAEEDIILDSELKQNMEYIRQDFLQRSGTLPPEDVFRNQVLEKLITESLQLQMARRGGLRIDDDSLNITISKIAAQNNLSVEQFRKQIEQEGQSYAYVRDQIRRDLLISQLRQQIVGRRINITDQDIKNFLASDTGKTETATVYHIGHILIPLPAQTSASALETTRKKAQQVRQTLLDGASFGDTAAAESGGQNALQGGDLGWRNASQLPSIFAEPVEQMESGAISGLITSASGFHIIKLLEKRGGETHIIPQTHVRHILIKPNEIRDQLAAKNIIDRIRNDITAGKSFEEMAKTYSDDPSSARKGGDLNWVNPGTLVPQFERTMNNAAVNTISEPFLSQYGWHILEVMGRRDQNMGKEYRLNQARAFLQKRRFEEELQTWVREVRQDAYVNIKI